VENSPTQATKLKNIDLFVSMLLCLLGIFLLVGIYLGRERAISIIGENPVAVRKYILKQCTKTDDGVCTANVVIKVTKDESGHFSLEWQKN